jgi:hypothetical protein
MVSGQRNKKFLGEKMILLNKPGKNMWQIKLYLVVLFLVIPAVMICPAAANPPSAVNLVYNSSSGELAVTITHVVADPADHFIKLVEVHSGGAVLISEQYSSQPATENFTYRYTVPAPGGDLLEVTASCNKFGSLTATIPVQNGSPPVVPRSGIPPILLLHMGLMITGFTCIVTSVYIAGYQRKWKPWFRTHKILSHMGSIAIIAGLGVAVYMVGAFGAPHFRSLHGMIGAGITFALLVVITMGIGRAYVKSQKPLLRTVHVFMGYLTAGLMVISVITGLIMVFG